MRVLSLRSEQRYEAEVRRLEEERRLQGFGEPKVFGNPIPEFSPS